jgi:oligopeptide/dipeptide ABC transporter ATP-binding protein
MGALLQLRGLVAEFNSDAGRTCVLDGVDLELHAGEMLGLVGESGCGKSVLGLSLLGLLGRGGRVSAGQVLLEGEDLTTFSEQQMDGVRGKRIAMVFQDALAGLNPVFTVGNQLIECLQAHQRLSRREAHSRAVALLERVGLPNPRASMRKHPHTLSGGMRQRVMIAMALASEPQILIADEPTTALDVTIQAQIMGLLRRLQRDGQMSVMLITHDIGLVAQMTDRVLVMYAGQIVEQAPTKELFTNPAHPYTRALLASVPRVDGEAEVLQGIPGSVPENYGDMVGCRFFGRCPYATEACMQSQPLREVSAGHTVRCCNTPWVSGGEEGVR